MWSPPIDFDKRWAREDRADRHGHTREEARALYRQAAKSAACCGDCGQTLSATDSVTMVRRNAGRWKNPDWIGVPICLLCTLDQVANHWSGRRDMYNVPHWRRTRCLNCHRLVRNDRFCCNDCKRAVRNERNKLRRRVEHAPMACVECGRSFIPKRADAVTCSNRCRQARHRRAGSHGVG